MIELLLYTTLTCKEADDLMLRISKHQDLPASVMIELVETVKDSAPECYWDAND